MTRYRTISLPEIEPPKKDVTTAISDEKFQELVQSIKIQGVLQPVIVRPIKNGYELIAGFRRCKAAAAAGLTTVPAIIVEKQDKEADVMKLHENFYREDMSPLDEARTFKRFKDEYGMSLDEMAALIGKSKSYISARIDMLEWDSQLQEAVESEKLNYSVARELAHIQDPSERKRLTKYAIESGCSAELAAQWRRESNIPKNVEHEIEDTDIEVGYKEPPTILYYPCPICDKKIEYKEIRELRLCPDCYRRLTEELGE